MSPKTGVFPTTELQGRHRDHQGQPRSIDHQLGKREQSRHDRHWNTRTRHDQAKDSRLRQRLRPPPRPRPSQRLPRISGSDGGGGEGVCIFECPDAFKKP